MSASAERPERLAEILREIIALSNPTWTNDSRSSKTGDPLGFGDAQRVNEIDEPDAARGKETREESSES